MGQEDISYELEVDFGFACHCRSHGSDFIWLTLRQNVKPLFQNSCPDYHTSCGAFHRPSQFRRHLSQLPR